MSTALYERTLNLDLLDIRMRTRRSGAVHFVLHGDIDISNASDAAALLLLSTNYLAHDVTCDLSGIEFMDSSGLWLLVRMQHYAAKNRSALHIVMGRNEKLKRILRITGLDSLLTII